MHARILLLTALVAAPVASAATMESGAVWPDNKAQAGSRLEATAQPIGPRQRIKGTKLTITFEHVAPNGGYVTSIGTYDGFTWTNVGVGSRSYFEKAFPGATIDSYLADMSGNGVADALHGDVTSSFASTTNFTLISGNFAAGAINKDITDEYTFTAFRSGVQVAQQTFTIGVDKTTEKFGAQFRKIDTVTITSANGNQLAMDNIKVKI